MDYYNLKLEQKLKWKLKLKHDIFPYSDTYNIVDEYILEKKLEYSNQRMDELESRVSLLEEQNALLLAKIDSLQKGHNSQETSEASKMNIADSVLLPLDTMQ